MSLAHVSYRHALRHIVLVAGMGMATSIGCGDDDDDDTTKKDAGTDAGEAGTGGKGGAAAAGKSGGAGKGGQEPGIPIPAPEIDAGAEDVDAGGDGLAAGFRDLSIQMSGMTDEVGEFMQFRLIGAGGEILTIAALHGLPAATFTFDLPATIPPDQEVELEVWADTFGTVDNAYDAAMDHAWTATIAAAAADEPAVVMLAHGTQSPPPTVDHGDAAGSLGFTMMDTNDYAGDLFELRVIETTSGRVVARHVLAVPGSTVALEVYGVIVNGTAYHVDFAIDVNGNMQYDAPSTDAAWRQNATGSATGFNSGPGATITLAAPPASSAYVDVGF